MNFRDRAVLLLATGFSVGRIPLAPEPLAACWAFRSAWYWPKSVLTSWCAAAVAFVLFAVWIAGKAERLIRIKDAPAL